MYITAPLVVQRCVGDTLDNYTFCGDQYYINVLSAYFGTFDSVDVTQEECRNITDTCLISVEQYFDGYYKQIEDSCNGKTTCTGLDLSVGVHGYCYPDRWSQFTRIYYECTLSEYIAYMCFIHIYIYIYIYI